MARLLEEEEKEPDPAAQHVVLLDEQVSIYIALAGKSELLKHRYIFKTSS